ncbi:uncharacterized protein DUF2490 [Neolewinella xylanilytica]|uniref:Uncharacterized protein DUF2490 n=1 Tax=Neolewinella xylanilytica TaxID=1514080 RepID=A0A2S6I650_9BACT|nr:DUF2490 domain-containing protein [Neolewinella xylanilytica]PPK86627.1 uncharacterized protein DUF2490 [Neolewinella xylanilytica]
MPHWVRYIFLLAALVRASDLRSQLHLFSGAAFEHEVTPNWGYEFEIEHRQIVNTGAENRVLVTGAINRLIGRYVSVAPGLRITPFYGQDPTEVRIFTDLYLDYPLGDSPLTLEGRLRSQYEFELTERPSSAQVAVRPRIGLACELHETVVVVGEMETRYRFDVIDGITEYRYTLGLSVLLSTRVSVESFIRLDSERKPEDEEVVAGILINYVLPDRRHLDWEYRRPFGRSLLW